MSERIDFTAPLKMWQGDRGTYHLVTITGEAADAMAMHERLRRLEFGARRGFGSVKVLAKIGKTGWKTSVFPQNKSKEWVLLISKKIMHTEDLVPDQAVAVELELI